ncbi:hypothetical protein CJ483_17175 [Bacillus sp. PK3_68]|nr:hypothetical protein CJ483_17175 [Bacillus sp. PK3_68]
MVFCISLRYIEQFMPKQLNFSIQMKLPTDYAIARDRGETDAVFGESGLADELRGDVTRVQQDTA